MSGFGQYDTGGGNARRMPTAIYDFGIVDADVKRDGSGAVVRDPKTDRARFVATLEVRAGEFKGERVKRTMNVTYDPSSEGKYGPFAQFIEAATGIPCGDARQKEIGRDHLRGGTVRGMVKHEKGYNNVTEFVSDGVPAETRPAPAQAPRPAPAGQRTPEPASARPAPAAAPQSGVSLDYLLSEVSFPVSQQIRALAKWANLSDAQLAVKIGFFSGHEPLKLADVAKVNDKIRAERAA
jgi:hypothetical protein